MEFSYFFSFRQKLYHYINDDENLLLGKCLNCGKQSIFNTIIKGYNQYCSKECRYNSKLVIEKRKNTSIEKYGINNYCNRIKSSKTLKDTYNKKKDDILCKREQTCLEKYGVKSYVLSNEYKNKYKNTCLEKYGVEHSSQSQKIKDKIRQTNLEKYGVENVFQSQEVKDKIRQTNLEKYGVGSFVKTQEYIEKTKQTDIEKYGVEYPQQSEKIRKRVRLTNLEKYGVENVFASDKIKEKIKKTIFKKYGVYSPMQSEAIKEKNKKTCLEKYGVEYPMQSEAIKEKNKKTCLEKYGVEYNSQSIRTKDKIQKTCLEKYGVLWPCQIPTIKQHSNDSKPNKKIAKILEENNIIYKREFSLNIYSYDFKIENILVEINPTITHNSYLDIFGNIPKTKKYHLEKLNTAEKNDYKCIHVWDWDDTEKIINILKTKETLYARNLILKEVSKKECDEFLNKFHLQNTCKGQTIRYGLYKDDILVQIMTFGKPRYNKNYELELLRLCSHKDYKIVGGAEKIFKYILDKFNPESIISYCDNSKFNGEVYIRLGFSMNKKTEPSKHWYNIKTKQHITDNLLRQRGFDQLFGTDYGKYTSNEELMFQHGFLPVYDCGQMTFVYQN